MTWKTDEFSVAGGIWSENDSADVISATVSRCVGHQPGLLNNVKLLADVLRHNLQAYFSTIYLSSTCPWPQRRP